MDTEETITDSTAFAARLDEAEERIGKLNKLLKKALKRITKLEEDIIIPAE